MHTTNTELVEALRIKACAALTGTEARFLRLVADRLEAVETGGPSATEQDARARVAEEIRAYWEACGDFIGSNNSARLAFEAIAAQAEGNTRG